MNKVQRWREVFKEGWECADCEHRKVIVLTPDGYAYGHDMPPPIPHRMCMAGGADKCPAVWMAEEIPQE